MPDGTHPYFRARRRTRWQRRWTMIVDWLGAQKPLNLILGAVVLINIASVIAHLI